MTTPQPAQQAPTSYPLHRIQVVLFEGIHPRAAELFEAAGYSVRTVAGACDSAEALEQAAGAHIVGVRSRSRLTRDFFQQARRLWAVGCFCIGTEQVDLDAAAARGVAVFNAPFSNTRSVAELTIAEVVALSRRIFERSQLLHAGTWRKDAHGAHEVRGRTLGVVGYGRIGSQVSLLAEALGMRVLYHDVAPVLPLGNARPAGSLEALLRDSDVVTLHVPGGPSTKGLIGARQISQMRQGALLINNARGDVVDLDALAQALREGRLGGAAVDVFPNEPSSAGEPFDSPLRSLPNVVLTPHIGGSTQEAQQAIAEEVASKLVRFMNNGSTSTAVNVPEVDLPQLAADRHRILHFHRNVPGVLSALHRMIADLGVNVHAEALSSDPRHGYVILDVDPTHGEALKQGLRSIPETIRVRTLW
ncbi:MAG: phosphoglycerate dehydrogenase [Planctomycetota bacterium]|nr:MAG: phosphoglycerate dehydrogenase [Planctomycetota bacterium]